ncbi:IS200/IS605 family element RNA-guided endonuclease TnpB [Methanoplanus endosymbiosus]|uniref:IS200/IS605 family element RNA-guided endonuclease TnpB n=1 Tax=Methanoplanus endosymbiosus TaxID=33865 RepID=A0A9E7PQX1_9EURY|nr:IS200/IS605 family element RNA-guided endonuclease TnpB [Methanoplanus endosymbiosus]UUX93692.1 IS200/IS605 family element RNA-guided endonuclease TnpB [Methanoplanus endosymbiosus]
MLIAYKFRMYPNKSQIEKFEQHFGACRFVYNFALEIKIKSYETDGKSVSRFVLNKMLPELKQENEWLKEVNSQSLQGATLHLDNAFTKFFREKKGFPKFKSRKNPVQSFSVPQAYSVDFDRNCVKLPKIGYVKTILHRRFNGNLKTATVSRNNAGKYFISILVDDELEYPLPGSFDASNTIGLDVGIKDFVVTSEGNKYDNPKFLKNSEKRLKTLQRRFSRKKKGSSNFKKAKLQLAKQHEKVSNQRNDFQHKISFQIISENQAIAVETLKVENLLKNHKLAKSISDAGWSAFFEKLKYKAERYGKTILQIGQFEPSTKICSNCGYYNSEMTLSIRDWVCPDCEMHHDRDINAAINIKKFALDRQNLIGI